MPAWRMSLRVGNRGPSMWKECLRWSVAAITYSPLRRIDLSKHLRFEPHKRWAELKPTQKASLGRVAYEIEGGDVIYIREGSKVIGKGVVKGARGARAYRFDSKFRVKDLNGTPWAHQVPVAWEPNFTEIPNSVGRDQLTVKPLTEVQVGKLERQIAAADERNIRRAKRREKLRASPLAEDAYFRESNANKKVIIPRHNKLSNDLCEWLRNRHGVNATQEEKRVDVCFEFSKHTVLAELKVCYRVGTTKSIREAMGQLFEYNYYPNRLTTDVWLIVLDREPSAEDKEFITTLREKRSLPLTVGWRIRKGFSFHPAWP